MSREVVSAWSGWEWRAGRLEFSHRPDGVRLRGWASTIDPVSVAETFTPAEARALGLALLAAAMEAEEGETNG